MALNGAITGDDEIQLLLARIDLDGDGVINQKDFCKFFGPV
jgi:Ca2+-binding EF-hand superfamily protein